MLHQITVLFLFFLGIGSVLGFSGPHCFSKETCHFQRGKYDLEADVFSEWGVLIPSPGLSGTKSQTRIMTPSTQVSLYQMLGTPSSQGLVVSGNHDVHVGVIVVVIIITIVPSGYPHPPTNCNANTQAGETPL